MKALRLLVLVLTMVGASLPGLPQGVASPKTASELAGLWSVKQIFRPELQGVLLIREGPEGIRAEIAGRSTAVKVTGAAVKCEFPGGEGAFLGQFNRDRTSIEGQWMQPGAITFGRMATPVTLARIGKGVWRGNIVPLEDSVTFYLMIKPRADGTVQAFMRNPERNLGWMFFRIDTIERDGDMVRLLAAPREGAKGRVWAEGRYDPEQDVLSVYFQSRGMSFDFRRVAADEASDFYPRGRPSVPYVYTPPPQLDDGWPVGTLEEVGISRPQIEKFIQMVIDTPMDSARAQEDHAILIARHGKLVLEEYFHGESRDKPHDTRSASKSVASDLMGASIFAGTRIDPSDRVYQLMNGGSFPAGLDPRKRALTVEHLLTMSSGFDCDEGDEKSAGFEDKMWGQNEQPDFYRWTMDLAMVRDPGEKGVYCSAGANLTGGVVARAAGRNTRELFPSLLAGPLGINRYYLSLSPQFDYTLTGGTRLLARDFMKLAQLHLNGGTWKGRRIYTQEWSRRATSFQVKIGERMYGYLWWVNDYPFQGRTVRAYFAAGNGGQIAMAVPELDLVMAFNGGNYNAAGTMTAQNIYVPQYILPAVGK